MIKVKLLADSVYGHSRVTTFELEYPRWIHSELKTHRVFSSNSASSRAIPLNSMIDLVIDKPAIPQWTMNQKGMSGKPTDDTTRAFATAIWIDARDKMIDYVKRLQELGIHKQNANRLLEPFQHIKTILTGTDFDNFFKLRISNAAQPEICELATRMKEIYEKNIPLALGEDLVHCPYATNGVTYKSNIIEQYTSVALCAQVSYRKENSSAEAVNRIINNLIGGENIHASPFEHICIPDTSINPRGNLRNFKQLRHCIENYKEMGYDCDYDHLLDFGINIWSL